MKAIWFGCHSDDEMLAAGTLHRLVREGWEVWALTFAPAAIHSDLRGTDISYEAVRPEWQRSMELIGVTQQRFMKCVPSIDLAPFAQAIADAAFEACEQLKPDLAITLSPEDENPAHRIVGEQTERVMRGRVSTVLRCHFPWNFGLGRPNVYVKLSQEDIEVKRKVIDAYQSQAFRYDYSNMLMSYLVGDGLSVKAPYAERFELVRAVL